MVDVASVDLRQHKIPLEKQLLFTIWGLAHSSAFSDNSDRFNISKGTGHYIFKSQIKNINHFIKKYIKWPNNEEKVNISLVSSADFCFDII